MNTKKILMLASAAVVSIGVGAAMAQETGGTPDYWGEKMAQMHRQQAPQATMGASAGDLRSFWTHSGSTGVISTGGGEG